MLVGVSSGGGWSNAPGMIASLTAAGLAIPVNIPEHDKFPWVVEFADINGSAHKFKVRRSVPDRALGLVVLHLEAYG